MRHEKTTGARQGETAPEAGPARQTAETQRIQAAFDLLGASEATYERVMDMTRNDPTRRSTDAKLRTHRITRRAFVTCAALSAVAVGGVAYAAVETDFFRTAFGDKGLDDTAAHDVTEERTGSTYTVPGRQWVSTDPEEAQRLLGDYVERIDGSVSCEGYTLTVGACVMDENGLGVADFTLTRPEGLNLYEPAVQGYGELVIDGNRPIAGVTVTDAAGEQFGDSREIIDMNSLTKTSLVGTSYFDIARWNGMTVEGGVGWSIPSSSGTGVPDDIISHHPVKYAPATLFTCEEGTVAASLSSLGVVLNRLEGANGAQGNTNSDTEAGDAAVASEWSIHKLVMTYADGSEYIAQDEDTYNIVFGDDSNDMTSTGFLFNRLVDPAAVTSITVSGLHLGDPDIVLVP